MDDKIKIFDSTGNEVTVTMKLLKDLVKDHAPEYGLVKIADVKTLVNQKTELETIVKNSVEIIVIFYDMIGNKMPSSFTGAISVATGLFNKFSKNPEIFNQISQHVQVIQQLAPNHLDEKTVQQLEVFAPKQIQS